ncbi:MAG: carboxypeptidase regulatory-like domain-containing protein [Candidatus Acidiferrales bacterium]
MTNQDSLRGNVYKTNLRFLLRLMSHVALLMAALVIFQPCAHAQLSGSLAGTVTDPSGSVVPNATVTLTNQASQEQRQVTSNKDGYFAFAAVLPGTYTVKVDAPNFKAWQQTDIVMHPGDTRSVADIHLEVGTASQTVEVVATSTAIAPVDTGARESVLTQTEINDIPLVSRNLSEVLKILPGVTTTPNGISGGSGFVGNFLSLGLTGSTIGVGLNINGSAYRGGTGYTLDGADILDPGCNCWSTALVDPDMTQEVQVQTSNFGADVPQGPEVVNAIGKSGTKDYHGQAYIYARNDVLNANDWVDNSTGNPRGSAYYYYPGASFGGPVPFTRKKVFFWFGYEHAYQNTGSSSSLESYIPAPGMLAGNFTSSGQGVSALCPNLDANGNSATPSKGVACSSINGMVLPDGTTVTNGMIPQSFLDPGAAALASIWPTPNITSASEIAALGGYNYRQTFPTDNNLYWFRPRVDYDLNDYNKFFVSFQYGRNSTPAGGTGAHIWYTPANSIPFPGGGVQTLQTTKLATGHFIHVFNNSTTNEFIATWSWDNNPNTANIGPVSRDTLGYPSSYGTVFKNPAITMIPSFYSAGGLSYPEFSQPDFFDPGLGGSWLAKKQSPSFADNVTKVWGSQTIKVGFYYQNVGNLQGGFNYPNGVLSFGGQNPDYFCTTPPCAALGSSNNPLADFVTGIASGYQEASGEPYQDMAYRIISGYFDDSYKVTRRLTIEFGLRLDHIGHWYDRQGTGMAAFFPNLVLVDQANDRPNPGVRYHGIDPGVAISGSPSRFAFASPRFGVAYDVFGDGKTVVRGGWGAYRWNDQVNDYQGTLETSQTLLTYNLPGGKNVLLSQIGNLPAPISGLATPGAINGSIYATDPNDYNVPVTYSYNFTISRELPWRSLFEIAYVGSDSQDILLGGQNGSGNITTATGSIIDRNKMPLGALFLADPVTGLVAADPQNPGKTCTGAGVCNQYADYLPYGKEYGTNGVIVPEHNGYANYNAMQIMWAKSAGNLNFNLNYTWSKALGTSLSSNPYSVAGNYGVLATDRSHVINTSYIYNVPNLYHGDSAFVNGATKGWMISGTTTWQSGGNLAANDSANLGLNVNYWCGASDPTNTCLAGYGSTSIGAPTYFGTTAQMYVQPDIACNPTSGLASRQIAKLGCFGLPAVGSNGPRNLPYIKLGAFWGSDLAIAKTFRIGEKQSLLFRASANNWLNHPLLSFSGTNQFQLNYLVNYLTGEVTAAPSSSTATNWGFFNTKVGSPNQRILQLEAKYSF